MAIASPRAAADAIIRRLHENGHVALLAGGCVRDELLGRVPKDYDVATNATPDRIVSLFRRTRKVGIQFGVVLVLQGKFWIEVATFRSDVSYSDGRHPDAVVFGSPEEDAERRDFTVNGLFFDPLADRVIDYVDGRRDLEARVIRAIGDPRRRFAEDYLRMIRAVRLAAELGFEIDGPTRDAIAEHPDRIEHVSSERTREELTRLLVSGGRAAGVRTLHSVGLLRHIITEIGWSAETVGMVAGVLERLPDAPSPEVALTAALLPAEPSVAARMARQLTCSNATIDAIGWLRRGLTLLEGTADPELADLKVLIAGEHFESLIALWRALRIQGGGAVDACDQLMARAGAIPAECVQPPPLITGDDLIGMGYAPGPAFRPVLDAVYRAQLNETIGDRASAEAMARTLIEQSKHE